MPKMAAALVPLFICLAGPLESQELTRARLGGAVHAGGGFPGALGAGGEVEYHVGARLSLVADATYWVFGIACEDLDGNPCPDRGWSAAAGARFRFVRNFPLVPYLVAIVGPGGMSDGTRGVFIQAGFGAEWPATRLLAFRTEFQGQGLTGRWAGFPGVSIGVRVRP